MAYGNNTAMKPKYSGAANKGGAQQATRSEPTQGKVDSATIFKSGLFAGKEGSKSLASVQVKEDIMIPAGSYINLFQNEQKSENHPPFTVSVRTGTLKPKQ